MFGPIQFDATTVNPQRTRRKPFVKYDYWNLHGETFGLLRVLRIEKELDSPTGKIPFYMCGCNCRAQFLWDDANMDVVCDGFKMTMPAHLFNAVNSGFAKGVWCCDACKAYYRRDGSHILQAALWRMQFFPKLTLADALVDAETQIEVESVLSGGNYAQSSVVPVQFQR